MLCLVASSLWFLLAKGTQGVCGGVEEIGVGFQQWDVAGSEARRPVRGHVYSLSVATPTTFLPREQMQSLKHALHRLGSLPLLLLLLLLFRHSAKS